MKVKLKKGLRHLSLKHTGLSSTEYDNLIQGKEVALNEKKVGVLKDLGVKLSTENKKKMKEEK